MKPKMLKIVSLVWMVFLKVMVFLNATMIDGTEGQTFSASSFPEVAFIQNEAEPHETLCLGAIYNSFTIFTSDTCPLDATNPEKYRVVPTFKSMNSDNNTTAFVVVKIASYGNVNLTTTLRVKILYIAIPGMEIPVDTVFGRFVTDWEEWLDIVNKNSSGSGGVMSFSSPPKGFSVLIKGVDSPVCNSTYAQHHDPAWLPLMLFEQFCLFNGTESVNLGFSQPLPPGTPCEDSIGSPIITQDKNMGRVIIGLLTAARCSDSPPWAIALASPEFLDDIYFTPSPRTYEPTPDPYPPPTDWPTRRRSPFPPGKETPPPPNQAAVAVIHLQIRCLVVFLSTYSGL